ncbi:Mrr restriction system protein [Salisediminibacterium beveridgei]|uniref:Mrr restriction system protein n=2 Tax=Salisediminibacterium beveridgei TaxID=632773 RepID=A0A1D7QZN7_9BACI|nr:Mrr restriction system protein [Salisediminibacterium beveridgei]
MADYFQLSEEEINEKLPSDKQAVFRNRVSWANTYLYKAALIETVKRGVFRITDKGKVIVEDPTITKIDRKFLTQFDSFNQFINNRELEEPVSRYTKALLHWGSGANFVIK